MKTIGLALVLVLVGCGQDEVAAFEGASSCSCVDGALGSQGSKGDQGEVGPTGEQGPKGDQGEAGPTGPAGWKGDPGEAGPQGPQGQQGIQGVQGQQGVMGATGPQGQQGPTGPKGSTGDPGAPLAVADTYVEVETVQATQNDMTAVEAICDPGDVVLGGSCEWSTIAAVFNVWVLGNHPIATAGTQGWHCKGYNMNAAPMNLRANAICYSAP